MLLSVAAELGAQWLHVEDNCLPARVLWELMHQNLDLVLRQGLCMTRAYKQPDLTFQTPLVDQHIGETLMQHRVNGIGAAHAVLLRRRSLLRNHGYMLQQQSANI